MAPSVLFAADLGPYWRFSGVFHPAVAHFPIALLLVAGLIELFRFGKRTKVPGDPAFICLVLGAIAAVVTSALGWANADAGGEYHGTLATVLDQHRWMGVGVAALAIVTVIIAIASRRRQERSRLRWPTRLGLAACALLVGLVGSHGGKLTHGLNYYNEAWDTLQSELHPKPATELASTTKDNSAAPASPDVVAAKSLETKPAAEPVSVVTPGQAPAGNDANRDTTPVAPDNVKAVATPGSVAQAVAAATIDFHTQIQPLFATHCHKCHDSSKKKGEYRMDDRAAAFVPGDSGEMPIVRGNAEDSMLIKVLEGKGDYEDTTMPPKGARLTTEQIALVRQWINEGADWPQ
ncbi:MAG: c-type cytochrome domain-containing protein [Phycisphaeraceae bacterium]